MELRRSNLDLPAEGWGWIVLETAAPEVDKQWSDSGVRHESRELKHRAVGATRRVPCPPDLTALFHAHLKQFGTDKQGRLFWRGARRGAGERDLHEVVAAGAQGGVHPGAVRLATGSAPVRPATRGGVDMAERRSRPDPGRCLGRPRGGVLLRIYAKCLDGQEAAALLKIDAALKRV